MGAWGEAWNANDDYYDCVPYLIGPVTEVLRKQTELARQGKYSDGSGSKSKSMVPYQATGPLRAYLMSAYYMLSNLPSLTLSHEEMNTFTDAVQLIQDNLELASRPWVEPAEFMSVVRTELETVTTWLGEFAPAGLLEDRLPAIMEALNKRRPS